MTSPRVSLFRLYLKECENNVNINMDSYYKSGVITFMLAQASEYKNDKNDKKLCSDRARTIPIDFIF